MLLSSGVVPAVPGADPFDVAAVTVDPFSLTFDADFRGSCIFVLLTEFVGVFAGVDLPELELELLVDPPNPRMSLTACGTFLQAFSWRHIPSAFFSVDSRSIQKHMSLMC